MSFKPVFLWTDLLIWVLVAAIAAFVFYAMRHEHLRAPWRQVARRPLAMAATVFLSVYIVIGLLDSIHLQERLPNEQYYATEVLSVFDRLVAPLRTRVEKTFSSPFATRAFVQETIEHPDGTRTRERPRLRHGGAHLSDSGDRGVDVAWRVAGATLIGLSALAVLIAGIATWRRATNESLTQSLRVMMRGNGVFPWRTVLASLAVLFVLISNAVHLAPYYHILGTDQVGNDVFFRSLKSIRTGLVIGTVTTLVMLPFAVALGVMAGYFRGWVDDVIQYTYTTLSSIPGVLLIAAVILSLQVYMLNHAETFDTVIARSDMRLLFLCLILGVTSWTGLCRLLRGETLKLREIDYVQAAHALGVGHVRVMTRHVFPNVMHIVLITIVLDFSGLVLAEAVLSYVGVGVDPSMDSWGNMINSARLEMAREPMVWWSLAAAFAFMFVLVLAANLFADAVRDAFDPRLRT
jgi:peptide/nickel transport system permease protein